MIRYTLGSEHFGWSERIHGGITMTLLDEVMTWDAILWTRRACVAAEINARLCKPIVVGSHLRIIGNAASGKSHVVPEEGKILDEENEEIFASEGNFVPMSSCSAARYAEDFVEGPDSIAIGDIFEGLPT